MVISPWHKQCWQGLNDMAADDFVQYYCTEHGHEAGCQRVKYLICNPANYLLTQAF